MVLSPTPYGLPFPKIGGSQPLLKIASKISGNEHPKILGDGEGVPCGAHVIGTQTLNKDIHIDL